MSTSNPSVLYDGWSLAYQPNSPSALHLHTLLALQLPEVQSVVALPGDLAFPLLPGISVHFEPVPNTEAGRLSWEQRILPRLGRRLGADLVHLTTLSPALFGRTPALISPCGFGLEGRRGNLGQRYGLAARLRQAAAQGGLARTRVVIWPADLADPQLPGSLMRLPPVVPPAFWRIGEAEQRFPASTLAQPDAVSAPGGNGRSERNRSTTPAALPDLKGKLWPGDLPETYILYHGPYGEEQLRLVLSAWSWAAGAIGEYTPLLLLGVSQSIIPRLSTLMRDLNLNDTVRALPDLPVEDLARLYRGCSALFHPAEVSPWGGPVRLALACEKPVVGVETAWADSLVGPAAYLVPRTGDQKAFSRALGAALITVVVEEPVAEGLSQAASLRSMNWQPDDFGDRLLEIYASLCA